MGVTTDKGTQTTSRMIGAITTTITTKEVITTTTKGGTEVEASTSRATTKEDLTR